MKCLGDVGNTNLMLTFRTRVQREWIAETNQFISRLKRVILMSELYRSITCCIGQYTPKKRTGLTFLQHGLKKLVQKHISIYSSPRACKINHS